MPVVETIAVVASIIAIIQISDRVISACKFYIQALSDIPSELRAVLVEISTLKSVLESLQFLKTYAHAAPALWEQLSGQDGPIEECRRSITELEKLFPAGKNSLARGQSGSERRKVQFVHSSLAWAFKVRRVRELLPIIIRQKAMISLALTTESSQEIKLIKKDTADIRYMLTESHRQEIYRWLEQTDPSPIHNRAWKLHEQNTSIWILRSPEWNRWLSGDLRCLWIHGMPGAGKTILTSFLVEQVKDHCNRREHSAYSYYYCYFGYNQDEAFPFLTWIIARLCRQAESIPNVVHEMYRNGGQPSLNELLLALEASLQSFDIAYVIVDAADESELRENLLNVLQDLATDARFSKICCLVTSRNYSDIKQSLEPISHSIPMCNALVEDDIRKHVQSLLNSRPKFQRWPTDLRIEVEETVVKGSKGMFRWAVCQLDRLERLKCERQIIISTLATLPKTLDETYERIFMTIPKDEWSFARHALQWVCFHQDMYGGDHPMSMQILLAATELSTCNEAHQESDFEYDAERLRNMLGCLIDMEDNFVLLAHYTVKEYLESQRISESAAGYFWTGQEATIKDCARTILQEAQAIDYPEEKAGLLHGDDIGDTLDAFIQDFTVYSVVSSLMLLLTRQDAIASDEVLLPLAIDFVNPTLGHFDDISWICDVFEKTSCFFSAQNRAFHGDYRFPVWLNQQDCVETRILLHFLLMASYCDFPILADAFLKGKNVANIAQKNVTFCMEVDDADGLWVVDGMYTFDGSLLEVMAQLSFISAELFVWLLDECDKPMDTGLLMASIAFHRYFHNEEHKDRCSLKNSLGRQADPNAAGYLVTPLQIAVASCDIECVTELLEAGADPNTTGDQNGISFKTNSIFECFNELHGLSPLHICRNYAPLVLKDDYLSNQIHRILESRGPVIEALLLRHSAREFSS